MYRTSSYSVFVSWPAHLLPLHRVQGRYAVGDGCLTGVGSSHIELGNLIYYRGVSWTNAEGRAGEMEACILSRLPRIGCIVPAEMFGVQ